MNSLIRASPLVGYRELVVELGGDPAELMGRFHIPADIGEQENAFLPFRSLSGLYEASAKALDCPDFGLRLARRQGLEILGPIAVIARNAESVHSAFQSIARYLHIHSPALRLTLDQSGGKALSMTFEVVEPNLPQVRQIIENSLGIGQQILSLLAGPKARPLMVHFSHQRLASEKVYRDFFGCRVLFGQPSCGFLLPLGMLQQKITTADPEAERIALQYLESQTAAGPTSVADGVSQLVRSLLPTGQCRVDTVANQMCLHKRTLQRRLAEEGVRFEELVDRERRELAARYLAESGLQLSQISGLLGYAEQSALNRSCRRWFGVTPCKFRAEASQCLLGR